MIHRSSQKGEKYMRPKLFAVLVFPSKACSVER